MVRESMSTSGGKVTDTDTGERCGKVTYPGPAREGSRVVVHVVGALHVANSEYTGSSVGVESPIPNGLTAVAVSRKIKKIQGESVSAW